MFENKNKSQIRQEFYDSLYKNIIPFVEKLNSERKKYLVYAIIAFIIAFLLYLIPYVFVYLLITGKITKILNVFFVAIGGLLSFGFIGFSVVEISNKSFFPCNVWNHIKKRFENNVKKYVMPKICDCFGNLVWSQGDYDPTEFGKFSNKIENVGNFQDEIVYDYFKDSGMFPFYSEVTYDDVFQGYHNNVKFDIVEATFKRNSVRFWRRHDDKYDYAPVIRIFSGIIVKINMNKNFNGHTLIKPKTLLPVSRIKNLTRTKFETSEFSKKFDAYTNDEVEARYLITPSFMERLANVKVAFKTNLVSCAFYKNQFLMALSSNRDLFSIASLCKPIEDFSQYNQMFEEILSIIKLIDYFNLDQK